MAFKQNAIRTFLLLLFSSLLLTGCSASKTDRESIPPDSESITITVEEKKSKKAPEKETFTIHTLPYPPDADRKLNERYERAVLTSCLAFFFVSLFSWFWNWNAILAERKGLGFQQYRLVYTVRRDSGKAYSTHISRIGELTFYLASLLYLLTIGLYWYFDSVPLSIYFVEWKSEITKIELSANAYNWQSVTYSFLNYGILGFSYLLLFALTEFRIRLFVAKTNRTLGLTPIKEKSTLGWQLREVDNNVIAHSQTINLSIRDLLSPLYPEIRASLRIKTPRFHNAQKIRINPKPATAKNINTYLATMETVYQLEDTGYIYSLSTDEKTENELREHIREEIEEKKKETVSLEKIANVVKEIQQLFNLAKSKIEKNGKPSFQQKLDEIIKDANENKELKEYLEKKDWDAVYQALEATLKSLDRFYQTASTQGTSNDSQSTHRPSSDPYVVLGVTQEMTDEQIKKVYRELCNIYHPDKSKVRDDAKFKEIQNAYEKIQRLRRM